MGKIQDQWEALVSKGKSKGVGPKNAREARSAFYAGAATVFSIFMSSSKLPEAEWAAMMEGIEKELIQFSKEAKSQKRRTVH